MVGQVRSVESGWSSVVGPVWSVKCQSSVVGQVFLVECGWSHVVGRVWLVECGWLSVARLVWSVNPSVAEGITSAFFVQFI